MFENYDATAGRKQLWFVYLLPLADTSAFKVGFTCNPLQRIYSFSSRYYERFDLTRAVMLQLDTRKSARTIEANHKEMFAPYREVSPAWVPSAAGGHTEWFSGDQFETAHRNLQSFAGSNDLNRVIQVADYVRTELTRLISTFEPWAYDQALRVSQDAESVSLGYEPTEWASQLRDWVDAYRSFAIPLFEDDDATREFVLNTARVWLY